MRTIVLAAVLATSAASAHAQFNQQAVDETLAVCENMGMYGIMAIKQRDIGMPKETATAMVAASMRRNLNTPADVTDATIKVVTAIYDRVYADASIDNRNVEASIVAACSRYKDRPVDPKMVAQYLDDHPVSAWDPRRRVARCVKVAQSAANVATARDRGMGKEKMSSITASALASDPATAGRMPLIIDEVFANADLSVASLYAYNLARCGAQKDGRAFQPIAQSKAGLLACQQKTEQAERDTCTKSLLGL